MFIPPRRLVFAGGGMKLFAHLGAISYLYEKGYLQNVREFAGVSAGGFISLLCALKYTPSEIKKLCYNFQFSLIRHVDPEHLLDIMDTFGLDDGKNLEMLIKSVLHYKHLSPECTFQTLHEKGFHNLCVWATNIQTLEAYPMNINTTPHMSIVKALHASMAYPLYFIPVQHPESHHLLVDGGITGNYPIFHYEEEDMRHTLGITFINETQEVTPHIDDFLTFLQSLLACYYVPQTRMQLQKYMHNTIVIPVGSFPSLHFELSLEEKDMLFQKGYEATKSFITKYHVPSRVMVRRHSVA